MYSEFGGYASIATARAKVTVSSQALPYWYKYFRNILFGKCIQFEWDTGSDDIPNSEIEKIKIAQGHVGITDKYKGSKGRLGAFMGDFAGKQTIYQDMLDSYSFYSPYDSKVLKINKDIVVGLDNSMMIGVGSMVHETSVMLAHIQVTLIKVLVNGRCNAAPIGGSKQAVKALTQFQQDQFQGKISAVYDPAMSFVDFKAFPKMSDMTVTELEQLKRDVLEDFFVGIGIKSSHEKKGNMIKEEVASNDSKVLFNIYDRERCNERLCKDVKAVFGHDWNFKKYPCIDYDVINDIAEDASKEAERSANEDDRRVR